MKLQHLTIIFVIIILPISMVLSYYTNSQIKTINTQKTYQSKLMTATYDAVKSFQLNTINNVYSSLSDSKIRDIEASISSFYDSLGSELGTTRYKGDNELAAFIPAILYTLYDGYYIYGKYYNEGLMNEDGSYGDYTYGLKPYVYYSDRYVGAGCDFVINYTLDNYITIYGNIPDSSDTSIIKYQTKSGFLINPDKVKDTDFVKSTYEYYDLNNNHFVVDFIVSAKYDGVLIEPEVLKEKIYIKEADAVEEYEYAMIDNRKVYKENGSNVFFWMDKNDKIIIKDIRTNAFANALCFGTDDLHSNSACEYFYNAKTFSEFVNKTIGAKTNIKNSNGDTILFTLGNGNDPAKEDSVFNETRMQVIRNSIETNLSATMANFGDASGYEYAMPKLSEIDWYKLENNISVAAFMQGIPIGAKYFNDYCIVTNNKNEEIVKPESIYMIIGEWGTGEAHYPGCKEIEKGDTINQIHAYKNIDFEKQTVSFEERDSINYYPHENTRAYDCMVNDTKTYNLEEIINGKEDNVNPTLRQAYIRALAREKYDLYKSNSFFGV